MIKFAITLFLGLGSPGATPAATPAAATEMPAVKTGDIVFQTTAGGQSTAIMFASGSLYTHMGVVELGKNGKPMVVEAVGPVRTIPLEKWVAKGIGRRITVKRVKGLSDEQASAAVSRAHYYDGRPYDAFFYETKDAIYCSELVHAAFKEGPKLTLGKEEKVSDLKINNIAARKLIQQRWRSHPACQSRKTANFNACYEIILSQTLVTPASIARDPQLELIYTNFGPEAGER